MKNKYIMQFLSALVFLFAFSITTFAQQKVVTLEKAGTLSEQFTEEELNNNSSLKFEYMATQP